MGIVKSRNPRLDITHLYCSLKVSSLTVVIVFIIARLVRERLRKFIVIVCVTYPKRYSIMDVRGSRPIPGLVTSAAYTTKSALLFVVQVLIRSLRTYPKRYSIMEVRGTRPIPGLVTSAAYTTKSALLFAVQVRGSRPIPGLVTSAAYTTKSALLFVVQVLIHLPKVILHNGGSGGRGQYRGLLPVRPTPLNPPYYFIDSFITCLIVIVELLGLILFKLWILFNQINILNI
ncbi:hypothetical protein LXL04_015893 [Taraxacum kok-saghyz]